MELKRIGYWVSSSNPDLPDPADLISLESSDDRDFVGDYLSRGFVARSYAGASTCRICALSVGSRELSDGTYLWPEGLAHYVLVHAVNLPTAFVEHVWEFTESLESASVDDTWWKSHFRDK